MEEQERLILKMLRVLVESQKLSHRALGERLAEITGETWRQQKVWKVLNGKMELRVHTLLKLCDVFNVSLIELLARAQELREMPPAVREYFEGSVSRGTHVIVVVTPGRDLTKKEHTVAARPHKERTA